MRLYIDVKPSIKTARSRELLIHKLPTCPYTISKYGNYHAEDSNYVYAINIQKFNKKTKQVKSKKTGKTTSTIIRHKHYEGYVYKFPKAWLEATRTEVKQKHMNFELVSKK